MQNIKLLNFIDLKLEEKEMILKWRNHPDIRKWMYNQDEIKFEEHLNFIDSLKLRKDKLYFLVKKEEFTTTIVPNSHFAPSKKSLLQLIVSQPTTDGSLIR